MFQFQCLKRKKYKAREDIYAVPQEDDKGVLHPSQERSKCSAQSNIFTLDRYGINLFSSCFKGASKSYSPSRHAKESVGVCFIDEDTESKKDNVVSGEEVRKLVNGPDNQVAEGQRKSLAEKLFDLSKYGWYWGPLTQLEANQKLRGEADGSFLVRDSSSDQYVLTLSFRSHQQTFHTHIDNIGATFSLENDIYFDSMEDLIDYSMNNFLVANRKTGHDSSNSKIFVKLTRPVSRFTQVRPLQYLCRFVIRQYVRADMRQQLPLPRSIMDYIEEGQF